MKEVNRMVDERLDCLLNVVFRVEIKKEKEERERFEREEQESLKQKEKYYIEKELEKVAEQQRIEREEKERLSGKESEEENEKQGEVEEEFNIDKEEKEKFIKDLISKQQTQYKPSESNESLKEPVEFISSETAINKTLKEVEDLVSNVKQVEIKQEDLTVCKSERKLNSYIESKTILDNEMLEHYFRVEGKSKRDLTKPFSIEYAMQQTLGNTLVFEEEPEVSAGGNSKKEKKGFFKNILKRKVK